MTHRSRLAFHPTTLLVIGCYLAYFDRFVPAAGATLLKRELALSDAGFGLIAGTIFALAYATGALLFGYLARGRPLAPFLVGGMACWTVGVVATGYATRAEHFAIAQLLSGIGQAAFIPATVVAVAAGAPANRIGRVISRFSIASSLGRSSAALTAGAIIAAIGMIAIGAPLGLPSAWRATFLITALPNLVLILLLAVAFRRTARIHSDAHASFPVIASGDYRTVASLLIAACAAVVMIQSAAIWFPTLLVRLHALDPARAAMLAGSVTLVTAPLGQWIGGQLLDRRAIAPTLIVMLAIPAAGAALSILRATPPLGIALALLGATNLLLGIASLSALAGLQRATPDVDRTRVNGYFFAAVTVVGLGAGPALTGLLSDAASDPATALPRALGQVAFAMFGIAIVAHLLARSARPRVRAGTGE